MEQKREAFTKYEIARIIGARALQIAMDAPLLLKIPEEELKEMRFDSLKIAEKELDANVLPITINRPTPKKAKEKLAIIKEEKKVSDEELLKKEKEVEKEIIEDADQFSIVEEDETKEEQYKKAEEKPAAEEATQ